MFIFSIKLTFDSFPYRDLKPENILLLNSTRNGFDVKLADFGIAKLLSKKSQNQYYARNCSIGTPIYMAPETLIVSKNMIHIGEGKTYE